jgi:hypothetical protein
MTTRLTRRHTPSRSARHKGARVRGDRSPVSGARRVAILAGLLLLALAMSGCNDPKPAPPTTSPETTVADPDAVLNELAAQLRKRLDALTAGLKTTSRGVTGNSSGACGTPTHDRWPRQWEYAQRLFLTQADSRPTARQLADKLRAEGWSIRTDTDTSTDLELTAQLEGAVVFIGGGSTQGAMVVNGTTACVNADGTVDHRPVG